MQAVEATTCAPHATLRRKLRHPPAPERAARLPQLNEVPAWTSTRQNAQGRAQKNWVIA